VALIIDRRPFSGVSSVLLIGLGLLACAAVSVVGMVMMAGRWAHRLGWTVVAATMLVALARPIDPSWITGLGTSLIAAIALVIIAPRIRRLPSATGPGDRAVLLPLALLGAPVAIGAGIPGPEWAVLALGLSAPLAAFLYSRVVLGGLTVARLLWPALALGASPFLIWPGPAVTVALGGLVAILAWHPSVKAAFHPPREVGSTFPIPPELAPKGILDAARVDDTVKPV
jgi:hypothetical protein